MGLAIVALLTLLLPYAPNAFPVKPPTGSEAGIRIDDNGRATSAASSASTDAGVRIDPEGRT